MSEEQPQKITAAISVIKSKIRVVFQRARDGVSPRLRAAKLSWTTKVWPAFKTGVRKAWIAIQTSMRKLMASLRRENKPKATETKLSPDVVAAETNVQTAPTVMARMAAMTATVKTAYGNRRQKSTNYKPYRYHGVSSRLKRHSRQKVYRLKGYTTVARVNRKRRREYLRRQRNILLITTILVVAIIVIFMWIDPVPKLRDLLHDLGFITPPSS